MSDRTDSARLLEVVFGLVVFAVLVTRVPTVEHFLANNDHGYHLAAGAELLRGRWPGVDVFINYGPLAVLLGAATLYLGGGGLVVEAAFCAAAWGLAVGFAVRLTRRSFGAVAGLAAGVSTFFLIPRFHKWWVWLVPLAALAAIDPRVVPPSRRRWLAAGLVAGLAALMRPDLGLATLAALLAVAVVDGFIARAARASAALALALGFVLPILCWVLVLVAWRGPDGLIRAAGVVPEMVAGTVESLALAPPPFRLDDPFAPGTAHALALRLLPVTELMAVGIGIWLARDRRRGLAREGRTLAAIGIMGLASYHHTIYRADIHHLWQGIWPLALLVPAFVALAIRMLRVDRGRPRRSAALGGTATACAFVVLATIGLWPILRQPHFDLAPYGRPPLAGMQALGRGVAAAPEHPYAQLVQSIDRLSTPSDEVLVLVYGPQLLVFARRPASGPTVAYQRGLFDAPAWQQERLAQLRRHPPALIVVPNWFWQLGPNDDLRGAMPELYDFVRTNYRQIVDRRGRYVLLAPDPSFRPPST